MNGVHSQCLTDRQKDRGKDQACRCHIHKSTYDQQQDIDNKQDHVTVIADTKHSSTYCSWDTCKCHDPAHNTGYADQENDDTRHFRTVKEDLWQFRRLNGFVEENCQYHAVYNCNYTSFCSSKYTGNNTADNNNDHKQAWDRLEKYFDLFRSSIFLCAAIAFFLCENVDNYHTSKAPEDTRDITCHEKSCYRGSSTDQGKCDHNITWRN